MKVETIPPPITSAPPFAQGRLFTEWHLHKGAFLLALHDNSPTEPHSSFLLIDYNKISLHNTYPVVVFCN